MNGKAIILGSGTSNGVPMLGIDYSPEYLANPKNHRTRSSAVLQGPSGNVLIDCSPELRLQLVRENILDINAVIITHTHADHVMGMDDIRSFCLKYKKPMKVYTSLEYQEDIKRIFPYAFREPQEPGVHIPRFELNEVPEIIEECGLKIRTFWVEHGPLPCLGIRVNHFAYITDVSHIPDEAMNLLKGLDTLVLDAVRYRPHPNHFHYEKALDVAQQINARVTYLTHLSDDYDHHKTEAELPQGIKLAYDGLQIPF